MNGLVYLTDQDFYVSENNLRLGLKGTVFILVYSMDCKHCKDVIPFFKQLPQIIRGCQIAVLNISKFISVAHLSRNTKTPIDVVPFMILFSNGKVKSRYKGQYTMNDILQFLSNSSKGDKIEDADVYNETGDLVSQSTSLSMPICRDFFPYETASHTN
jgi:thioredoxin-like negative regulator of GroEL